MTKAQVITVTAQIDAPLEKVWKFWSEPDHITKWNQASADWFTPKAINDLQVGGRFTFRMESRDGAMGFDFGGTYTDVKKNEVIKYTMDDNRTATVLFSTEGTGTKIVESFEAETENPIEMQQAGWQAILDSFKNYVEQTNL